ncbi:hypothetical protein AVDCRST_MAG94-7146 [uncultured Leptolyngbya sp.]|uniref:Uncharacterized protein n=1 Tax=uncultured Leptolyngbya sp. TaxID=332963 RepID=A0A6J4PRK8_9CYAN|nr:hypothetical protein AVDCRST_MAG94-7146 [uncultured Leptolyngbya sp.]
MFRLVYGFKHSVKLQVEPEQFPPRYKRKESKVEALEKCVQF